MPTLNVTATTNYGSSPNNALVNGQNITAITFATNAPVSANFSANQFGGSSIANNVMITGTGGSNYLNVQGTADVSAFSAANWAFTNWSAGTITFSDASGDNTWTGSTRNDAFFDGAGNDSYFGGLGDDNFAFGNSSVGNDSIYGGQGTDTLSYSNLTQGVTVNLALGTAIGATIGSDVVSEIENVWGGKGDDSLTGDAGNNYLSGAAGNDWLSGGSGSDTLVGGQGNDTYVVDDTFDSVFEYSGLGGGYDTVRSTSGFSLGDSIEELVMIGNGFNAVGNTMSNVIDASANKVALTILGGAGNDTLVGSAYGDNIYGGFDNDTIIGGAGADNINGGVTGNDEIDYASYETAASAVAADLKPGSGLLTGLGTVGDAAGDTFSNIEGLIGSAFDDTLKGNDNADLLNGGGGNDVLVGRDGNDTLIGGGGRDALVGGTGNDFMTGGEGDDTLDGGEGDDLIFFDAADVAAYVAGGIGTDILNVVGGSAPTAFNLAAQGFERAHHEYADTTNQSWSTIRDIYAANWTRMQSNIFFDDGTRQDRNFDFANNQSYSEYVNYSLDVTVPDTVTRQFVFEDTGTRQERFFDYKNNQTYTEYGNFYTDLAMNNAVTRQVIFNDNSTMQERIFDHNNTQAAFSEYVNFYDAAGAVKRQVGFNDAGQQAWEYFY